VNLPECVLVTGGAGFIGSHLCEAFLKQDTCVICLDNFYPFYAPEIKHRNISDCLKHEKFVLIRGDIREPGLWENKVMAYRPRMVIHLAAMAGVRPSLLDPALYVDVNINGTIRMLEFCARNRIDRFVFASSSSVYGRNTRIPFSENDTADRPISPYAATKRAGELLCHVWHDVHGISFACLRLFTVFGPRQRPDLAICKFTELIRAGREIPLLGDGSSSRDYTYIADTVEGILRTVDYLSSQAGFEVFNLGNDRSVSLREMVNALERAVGIPARISELPLQDGDMPHTRADISKAMNILGYSPRTSFEEGLRLYLKWLDPSN
jgi:UDP-glucuronate 4-epimerase